MKMQKFEREFLNSLRENGLNISPKAIVRISEDRIELGILDDDPESSYFGHQAFASDVTIWKTRRFGKNNQMTINFGCSGKFDPTNEASYWRTIHAAEILQKWDIVYNLFPSEED